jgi:hypothetical protein
MLIPINTIILFMMQVFRLKNTILLHPFLTMIDGMTSCQDAFLLKLC